MQDDKQLTAMRESVRHSLTTYEEALKAKLNQTPRGSGHAVNEFDHLQASITQVRSAMRVLWMEG
jgi:hypothetical protein